MDWNHASMLEAGSSMVSPRTSFAETSEGKTSKYSRRRKTKKAADFMSYDSDHWVFRRFEKLSLFNILCLQQEIVDCESRLDLALRKEWMGTNEHELDELVLEIRSKLKEYGTIRQSTNSRSTRD